MQSVGTTTIGVVIVTFGAENIILDCLRSLRQSTYPNLRIIVVDNASTDDTRKVIRKWAKGTLHFSEMADVEEDVTPFESAELLLVCSKTNLGFAAGVNIGLRLLLRQNVDLFWILNPDCRVRSDAALNYARQAVKVGSFGLMCGRTLYVNPREIIQSDGGRLNRWTGMCTSVNFGRPAFSTAHPRQAKFDYIPGSNLVASRAFIESVGMLEERYFLYYEEVDWAFRRGEFELIYAPGAEVEHLGGSSIGSPVIGKKQGTSFSNYFNYRNRMRFMRRFFPSRLPIVYVYSAMKILRLLAQGYLDEADGAFRGLHHLPPPRNVRIRLSEEAARIAFAK